MSSPTSSPSSNAPSPSPGAPSNPNEHSPSPEQEGDSPAPETKPEQPSADSGAETAPSASTSAAVAPSSGDWQAIWSPAHNAYYFFNAVTQQTTWVNPLQPTSTEATPGPSSSSSASASASDTPAEAPAASSPGPLPTSTSLAQLYALQEAAAAQGIDPSLAHLDPTLAGPSAPGAAYSFTAKFNAHTGTFTKPEGRDPTHLSEYERMKRMSTVYFNMEQWEQEVAQRKQQEDEDAANGKKRKRPSKKDLDRFKEQKRLKKIAKTAWLRT
ncbi:hypothetical protein BC834DRAFT_870984, partial [Gloeopeniophorella convolvens]